MEKSDKYSYYWDSKLSAEICGGTALPERHLKYRKRRNLSRILIITRCADVYNIESDLRCRWLLSLDGVLD